MSNFSTVFSGFLMAMTVLFLGVVIGVVGMEYFAPHPTRVVTIHSSSEMQPAIAVCQKQRFSNGYYREKKERLGMLIQRYKQYFTETHDPYEQLYFLNMTRWLIKARSKPYIFYPLACVSGRPWYRNSAMNSAFDLLLRPVQ